MAEFVPESVTDELVVTTPEGVLLTYRLAGLGSRYLARLLDAVIRIALVLLFAKVVDVGGHRGWAKAVAYIGLFAVLLGYDIVSEIATRGRTLGKMAVGVRVIRADGRPVDVWSSVVRNLIRIIDEILTVGIVAVISIFATRRGQRLGDLAAGTVVIRERTFRAAPDPLPEWATDPNAPFLAWDTSSVTQDELGVVRSFLARRSMLTTDARGRLAKQLADRIRPRVPAAPDWTDEQFLVSVVAARTRRAEGVNR